MTKEERAPLGQEDRQRAQADWASLVCPHCGTIHPGECPRVKSMVVEIHYPGNVWERREIHYHDNDEWEVPPGARTAFDVFGPAGLHPTPPAPPPPPEPKKKA